MRNFRVFRDTLNFVRRSTEEVMTEILENITGCLPVYRVLNREENLNFFRDVLGMKVLLEEGAMVWLGGHEAKTERILLEESPGVRSVIGAKKHARTVLRAKGAEIEQILAQNLSKVSKLYQGKNGFAFEAVSPEHDLFLVTAESEETLIEVEKSAFSISGTVDFPGLSDFEFAAMNLNATEPALVPFFEELFAVKAVNNTLDLPFVKLSETVTVGEDLAAAVDETLDLEFLVFKIAEDFDLAAFATRFSDANGVYLDKSAKTFALDAPNNLEIWFAK